MSDIVYRLLERRDHAELGRLHRRYLSVDRDDAFFEWKYWHCPGGPHASVVAEETASGRIVGELGSIPVMMRYFGETAPAYFCLDIFIDKDAGRGRIFFPIYRAFLKAVSEVASPAVPILTSFTIPKTEKIMSRLWKIRKVAPAPKFAKVLRYGPYIESKTGSRLLARPVGWVLDRAGRLRYPMKSSRHVDIREIRIFDEHADRLWNKVKDYYNIWTVRDRAYLNWRYVDIPHVRNRIFTAWEDGELLGFLVINFQAPVSNAGVIQEFIVLRERPDVARTLLDTGIRFLSDQKRDVAIIWSFPHCHLTPLLQNRGFVARETTGRSLTVRDGVEFVNPIGTAAFSEARDPANWFLSKGDVDDD